MEIWFSEEENGVSHEDSPKEGENKQNVWKSLPKSPNVSSIWCVG
jgi:hypothetical protein